MDTVCGLTTESLLPVQPKQFSGIFKLFCLFPFNSPWLLPVRSVLQKGHFHHFFHASGKDRACVHRSRQWRNRARLVCWQGKKQSLTVQKSDSYVFAYKSRVEKNSIEHLISIETFSWNQSMKHASCRNPFGLCWSNLNFFETIPRTSPVTR